MLNPELPFASSTAVTAKKPSHASLAGLTGGRSMGVRMRVRLPAVVRKPRRQRRVWACKRCGWTWMSRTKDKPESCASCKSKYWDSPRRPAK